MRLLVVEDDPDLNRQLATALTEAGYVVDRAFDGEEGHYLGESEPYDAVILDIGLPKMDGISVLEAWRRAGRAMPVLLLTARDRWSDKVQGFDAGADDNVARKSWRAFAPCCGGPWAMPKANSPAGRFVLIRAPGASRSTATRSSLRRTNTGCCPI
jgi:CheY-like chemotaxis protein